MKTIRIRLIILSLLLALGASAQDGDRSRLSPGYSIYPKYVTFLPEDKLDSVFEYATTDIVPVVFTVDRWDTTPGEAADSVCRVIESVLHDWRVKFAYVWVGGSASPEGPPERNKRLGEERALVLTKYILSHTSLPRDKIRVENLWEDWSSTVRALEKSDFPNAQQVIDTIRSVEYPERRKLRIMAIDNGKTWRRMVKELFPPFRNARTVIVCHAPAIRYIEPTPTLKADKLPPPYTLTC